MLAHKRNQVRILSKAVTVFSDAMYRALAQPLEGSGKAYIGWFTNSYQSEYLPEFYSRPSECCASSRTSDTCMMIESEKDTSAFFSIPRFSEPPEAVLGRYFTVILLQALRCIGG